MGARLLPSVVIAVVLALLSTGGSARAAPLPSDFFGVSSPDLMHLSADAREPILADQRAAGVRLLRQRFDWSHIEPSEGSYDWAATDSFVASAVSAGMAVLPEVVNSPTWASRCPTAARPERCPPADYAAFGRFVVTLIGRYGPGGSFWADNPDVPNRPIRSWQLWNEPSILSYWWPKPDPAEYVQMLKVVVPMIRAADPQAELVSAGVPDSFLSGAIRMDAWVKGLYANGFKGLVDVVAIHIYDDTPANAIGLVEQTRATMDSNGDSATPIWVTEWGWGSAGKPSSHGYNTTLDGQAANIDALMGELVARHEELGLRGLSEYFWHDGSAQSNVTDTWQNHLGLVFQDYTHKPAYLAYQSRAIDTDPPDTTIDSGPAGTVPPGPQSVAFSATEAGSDFECRLDAGPWSACVSPFAVPALPGGSHTFDVRATDPYGNTDSSPASAGWTVQTPPAPVLVVSGVRAGSSRLIRADVRALARRLSRLDPRTLAKRRTLELRVLWPGPGRITLALKHGGIRVGRGTLLLERPGRARVPLRFTSRGRKLLARSRRLTLGLTEVFSPSSGAAPTQAHARLVLRRRA